MRACPKLYSALQISLRSSDFCDQFIEIQNGILGVHENEKATLRETHENDKESTIRKYATYRSLIYSIRASLSDAVFNIVMNLVEKVAMMKFPLPVFDSKLALFSNHSILIMVSI